MVSTPTEPTGFDHAQVFDGVMTGLAPIAPWLLILALLVTVLRFPMLGRGPGLFASRDPWRLFKYDSRRLVMDRAGGRCEGSLLFLWGRCSRSAEEADHVYPWSRGGATVPSNGQALCHKCNRAKANTRPAWWYIQGLERRRRSYFPANCDARIAAAMSAADRTLRSPAPGPRSTRNR